MKNVLHDMLLINEPSVLMLYKEMVKLTSYFIPPCFLIAVIIEFFGKMEFADVVKRLFIASLIMSSFYAIHTKAVDISLETASKTLKKVSPRNLFVKKWYESKVKTKQKSGWGYLESLAIPNLNDLVATTFFLLAKVFTWILKLIYSSVFHLTYVFSGITALLYFFGWTKRALIGTIQSSLWCMILPFVIVGILSLVGNTIDQKVVKGQLAIADVETILWLFGVTLILLLSPVITWGMVRGDGIAYAGSQMGTLAVNSGLKAWRMIPAMINQTKNTKRKAGGVYNKEKNVSSAKSNQTKIAGNQNESKSDLVNIDSRDNPHLRESSKQTQKEITKSNSNQTKELKTNKIQESNQKNISSKEVKTHGQKESKSAITKNSTLNNTSKTKDRQQKLTAKLDKVKYQQNTRHKTVKREVLRGKKR